MTRNALLLFIFAILGYGFWISPDSNIIAAGVAIFLLGMLSLEKGFNSFSGGVLANFLQRITPDMATSLMNDSAFSYDIQNNLINAAEILFANLYSTEKDMALEDAESDILETDLAQAGQNEAMLSETGEEDR